MWNGPGFNENQQSAINSNLTRWSGQRRHPAYIISGQRDKENLVVSKPSLDIPFVIDEIIRLDGQMTLKLTFIYVLCYVCLLCISLRARLKVSDVL